jgi:hypothetical protein
VAIKIKIKKSIKKIHQWLEIKQQRNVFFHRGITPQVGILEIKAGKGKPC